MVVHTDSPLVARPRTRATRRPSPHLLTVAPRQFLLRCAVAVASVLGCVTWIASSAGVTLVLGQIALGLVLAHGTELAHQCLHKTGTGRATVDHAIGRLFTVPTGVSFYYYLFFHLWHHKYNGTEQDLESFGYAYEAMSAPSRVTRVLGFVRHVAMFDHYVATLRRMALATRGRLAAHLMATLPMPVAIAKRVQADYQIMAALIAAALIVAVAVQSWFPVTLWLVPVVIGWGPAHALIELPEHFATSRPNPDPLRNTRSIRAGAIARYYTNANCDHVEHHSAPHVAMHRLALVREAMVRQGLVPMYADQNYLQFFTTLFVHLWRGPLPITQRAA